MGSTKPSIAYGDTYPSQQQIEQQRAIHGFDDNGVDGDKFVALFVNGHQITNFSSTAIMDRGHSFKYTLDQKTQKYYIDVNSGSYSNYNSDYSPGATAYAQNNGNVFTKKYINRGLKEQYYIKIYSGITQPDGTVSP